MTPEQVGKGREAIGEFWDESMGIYPDNRVRITLLVEEGEVVVEAGVGGRDQHVRPAATHVRSTAGDPSVRSPVRGQELRRARSAVPGADDTTALLAVSRAGFEQGPDDVVRIGPEELLRAWTPA